MGFSLRRWWWGRWGGCESSDERRGSSQWKLQNQRQRCVRLDVGWCMTLFSSQSLWWTSLCCHITLQNVMSLMSYQAVIMDASMMHIILDRSHHQMAYCLIYPYRIIAYNILIIYYITLVYYNLIILIISLISLSYNIIYFIQTKM